MSSTEIQRFKQVLKQHGVFATSQRLELFRYLQSSSAVGIQDIVTALPDQDQATIYRNIKLFEQLGIIHKLQLGWKAKIELGPKFHHHHHHMTCTHCGTIIAWEEDPAIELRIQTVALKMGFHAQDHQLEISGICQNCRQKMTPSKSLRVAGSLTLPYP